MSGKAGGAEGEAFIAGGSKRQEPKGKCAAFCHFLYNSDEGTILGRTPLSWLEITVFYIFFYAGLVGFWAGCLAIFLQTIDYKVPSWYGKGTIIGVNPGMGYQPWIKSRPDSTLIKFNVSDKDSYKEYVDRMDAFLAKYKEANKDKVRDCSKSGSNADEDAKPCEVKLDAFDKVCSSENKYGFKDGEPCVIITLNRLIGWTPTAYPDTSVPPQVAARYKTGDIPIHCEGEYFADRENMGDLKYLPDSGLAGKYFPYRFDEDYQQPFAMVKFTNPRRSIVMEVECKAYAYNIIHDRNDRQGMVHFELLVDDVPGKS